MYAFANTIASFTSLLVAPPRHLLDPAAVDESSLLPLSSSPLRLRLSQVTLQSSQSCSTEVLQSSCAWGKQLLHVSGSLCIATIKCVVQSNESGSSQSAIQCLSLSLFMYICTTLASPRLRAHRFTHPAFFIQFFPRLLNRCLARKAVAFQCCSQRRCWFKLF